MRISLAQVNFDIPLTVKELAGRMPSPPSTSTTKKRVAGAGDFNNRRLNTSSFLREWELNTSATTHDLNLDLFISDHAQLMSRPKGGEPSFHETKFHALLSGGFGGIASNARLNLSQVAACTVSAVLTAGPTHKPHAKGAHENYKWPTATHRKLRTR